MRSLLTLCAILALLLSSCLSMAQEIDWRTTAIWNNLIDIGQTNRFMDLKGSIEFNPVVAPIFRTRSHILLSSTTALGIWLTDRCLSYLPRRTGRALYALWSAAEILVVIHNRATFGRGFGFPVLTVRF